jgi:hypothetical protein
VNTTLVNDTAAAPATTGRDLARGSASGGGSRWAAAGWIAGLISIPVFVVITGGLTVPTDALVDNELVVEHLRGSAGWVWGFQVGTFLIALLTATFGLGLRRRLAGQTPAGSLLPDLAAAGMMLVAALSLVGGGISTEMFHSIRHIDEVDPDTAAAQLMIFDTMAWVWAGGILTTGATALAGIRYGAVGKGVARFAAVMTVLIALTQAVPLQYLAVLPVMLFLVVTGIALQREGKREQNALRL